MRFRAQRTAPVAVLIAWGVVLALLLAHHEMWRDELQAWLLARDSRSLLELWHNTRYEGHPLLWHVLLFPLAHAFSSPLAMQVLHWLIATAAAAILLVAAPFPFWVRVALIFSYFPLYEYGVISRNYALTVLGVWLTCAALARGSPGRAAGGSVLAANASPMGVLLGPALGFSVWKAETSNRARRWAVAVLALGVAVAVIQAWPAPRYEHARVWYLQWEPLRALYIVRGYALALLPRLPLGPHFWGASPWFPWPIPGGPGRLAAVAAPVAVLALSIAAVGWAVRGSARALTGWLVGLAVLASFAYVKFPGAMRHHGFVWVLMVAVVWIAVADGTLSRRRAGWLLLPFAAVGIFAAGVASWWDWHVPFSGAKCAARTIEADHLTSLPLVGGVDWAASPVAGYLPHARLYYPAARSEGSFISWNLARLRQDALSDEDIVTESVGRDGGRGVVLLMNRPLTARAATPCRLVAHCPSAIVSDEALWVYRCHAF